jgi:hypothetical protein
MMGQAKIKLEALRKEMLATGLKWDFPPSQWEASLCAELKESTIFNVQRASSEQLAWGRMLANKCHDNVRWYAENDPEKKSRIVTGWWVQWPNYVLHSVVERDGQMICITPTPFEQTEFPFIPDPKIVWTRDEDVYSFTRDGCVLGPGSENIPPSRWRKVR